MVYNFFDRKTSVEQLKMVISPKKKKKKKKILNNYVNQL